jgi:hypothetical protein
MLRSRAAYLMLMTILPTRAWTCMSMSPLDHTIAHICRSAELTNNSSECLMQTYSLGREGMARLEPWYIKLHIYIKTPRKLHIIHVYKLRTLTDSPPTYHKTPTKLKRATPKSWPDHGGTIPAQYRIHTSNREGVAPYDKAWRTLATARYPCGSQRFLVFTLSESCVLRGFLSLHATFTVRFDMQDVPYRLWV